MCFCARMLALESKGRAFYRKRELQIFLLISGGHISGQFLSTNKASPYKAIPKAKGMFMAKNLETVDHKDLRFG